MSGVSLNNSNIKMAKPLDWFMLDKTWDSQIMHHSAVWCEFRRHPDQRAQMALNLSLFNDPTNFLKNIFIFEPIRLIWEINHFQDMSGEDLLRASFGGAEDEKRDSRIQGYSPRNWLGGLGDDGLWEVL